MSSATIFLLCLLPCGLMCAILFYCIHAVFILGSSSGCLSKPVVTESTQIITVSIDCRLLVARLLSGDLSMVALLFFDTTSPLMWTWSSCVVHDKRYTSGNGCRLWGTTRIWLLQVQLLKMLIMSVVYDFMILLFSWTVSSNYRRRSLLSICLKSGGAWKYLSAGSVLAF